MSNDYQQLAQELGADVQPYKGTVDDLGWFGATFEDKGRAYQFAAMLMTLGAKYKGPFAPVPAALGYLVQFHI